MQEKRGSGSRIGLVLAILAGLFLCSVLGALVGGGVGYLLGSRAAVCPERIDRMLPQIDETPEKPDLREYPRGWEEFLQMGGALVTEVLQDSPAEKAGLRAGDIITAVDGAPVMQGDQSLADLILRYEVGDRIKLSVLRGAREGVVTVVLARHPDRGGETPWLGVYYQVLSADRDLWFETPEN